jgi:hypothetical protein
MATREYKVNRSPRVNDRRKAVQDTGDRAFHCHSLKLFQFVVSHWLSSGRDTLQDYLVVFGNHLNSLGFVVA